MTGLDNELADIEAYYARRAERDDDRIHDPLLPCNALWRAELQLQIAHLLRGWFGSERTLGECFIAEVGCGSGGNLLEFIRLGADPALMFANDLKPHLVAEARRRLPPNVAFNVGNAMEWDIAPNSVDLVMQYTVFSSMKSMQMRQAMADRMWSWLKPNGVVLSYDFVFDNPRNPNVRKLTPREVKKLFPHHRRFVTSRVTLAPPIARRLAPISAKLFWTLNAIPGLRTHAVCLVQK